MNWQALWQLLADAVLVVHAAFVVFVMAGLLLIILGGVARWAWIRNRWFRFAHLLAIGIVVVQAWLGIVCPLTTLEMWLRRQAYSATYEGSFVQYWLHEFLFWQAPGWVFGLAYTLFGLLVLLAWLAFPPRWRR